MQTQGSVRHTALLVLSIIILILPSCSSALVSRTPQSSPPQTTSTDARPFMAQITVPLLQQYLGTLCGFGVRYTGTINNTLASEWIYNSFKSLGLSVTYHNWTYSKFKSRDVVATLPGVLPDSQGIYIVSGHFDSVKTSPGADDDGSGAMGVLAIATALKDQKLNHTIRFITFSGEEVGTYGSFTSARESYYKDENIIGVLNLDMIGYANTPEGGSILRFYHPPRSQWIADYATDIAAKYHDVVNLSIEEMPNYPGNDAQAYIDYGYDGVWIAHHDGYPWGHSRNDSLDKINWTYYVKAVKLMCGMTYDIGMRPVPVQIRLTAPHEGELYFFNCSVRPLLFAKLWFNQIRGITAIVGRAKAEAEVITSEPIKFVIFCIDGDFKAWETTAPYSWTIWGEFSALNGKHKLQVFAYTTNGHVASDEMDLFIMSASDTFRYNKHHHVV